MKNWHDNVQNLEVLLEYSSFPAICPECGQREAHVYIRRYQNRGSLWIWCSHCCVFEHASVAPPSDWLNDEIVDCRRLTALPDYLEKEKEKIDCYMSENFHGLDFDYCSGCMRCPDFFLDESKLTCTQCKSARLTVKLEGHCILVNCPVCGYEVIGASFYAPCEADCKEYRVLIEDTLMESKKLVKLGAALSMNVLEVKKRIEANEILPVSFSLKEIMKLALFLKEQHISFQVLPQLRYSKFQICELKQ